MIEKLKTARHMLREAMTHIDLLESSRVISKKRALRLKAQLGLSIATGVIGVGLAGAGLAVPALGPVGFGLTAVSLGLMGETYLEIKKANKDRESWYQNAEAQKA